MTSLLKLSRPPQTDDELWYLIKAFWGVELPREAGLLLRHHQRPDRGPDLG